MILKLWHQICLVLNIIYIGMILLIKNHVLGLAYLSENKSQSSAIGVFNQSYDDFLNNKIIIKRIRTDNGPEYVYSYNPEYKYLKIEFKKIITSKGLYSSNDTDSFPLIKRKNWKISSKLK